MTGLAPLGASDCWHPPSGPSPSSGSPAQPDFGGNHHGLPFSLLRRWCGREAAPPAENACVRTARFLRFSDTSFRSAQHMGPCLADPHWQILCQHSKSSCRVSEFKGKEKTKGWNLTPQISQKALLHSKKPFGMLLVEFRYVFWNSAGKGNKN